MTLTAAILRDLAAGQSTADSLAPRIGRSPDATQAALDSLVASGEILSAPITIDGTPVLTIYRLPGNAIP